MKYTEALEWLTEQAAFGIHPGLERIRALLEALDNPQTAYHTIHVAGTNGKGSVVAMMSSVLTQSGIRTGRYISPHLEAYTERIAIDGQELSQSQFAHYLTMVRRATEQVVAQGVDMPTEFELLTAAAFLAFREEGCEYAVIETGMGGLLDSTNVIVPEVAVITNVSLDHMRYCGNTVEEIAVHKAGIIKSNVPVVTAARGDSLTVIKKTAKEKKAKCWVWGRDFSVEQRSPGSRGQIIKVSRPGQEVGMFFVPFFGMHQAVNASVAIMALTVVMKHEPRVSEDALREGIACSTWAGRFEVTTKKVPVIMDGAHNADGATALRMTLDEVYPTQARVFVFSSLEDKDLYSVSKALFRPEDRVILVPAPTPRSRCPEDMQSVIEAQTETAESIEAGLTLAMERAGAEAIVCVCGSLYLLGDARKWLATH